jgi:hypothetical protein
MQPPSRQGALTVQSLHQKPDKEGIEAAIDAAKSREEIEQLLKAAGDLISVCVASDDPRLKP